MKTSSQLSLLEISDFIFQMETSRVQETTTNKNVPLKKLLVEDLHSEYSYGGGGVLKKAF